MDRCGSILKRGCQPQHRTAGNLRELVDEYLLWRGNYVDPSIDLVVKEPDIESAIEAAVFAKHPKQKKHDHQFRVGRESMRQTCSALLARSKDIASVDSFPQVLQVVTECAAHGFGELAI